MCGQASFAPLPEPGHWIGSDTFAPLRGKLALVRCRSCGLRLINPRPNSAALEAFYSGDTYSCHQTEGSASGGAKAEFLLDRIDRVCDHSSRTLLDFGCGGGAFLKHAAARGWEARGFEPGRRGREECLRIGLNVTNRLDELPRGHFGIVTLHHVFEHLEDHFAALRDIRQLLAPRGMLFIEVPNVRSLRARLSMPVFSRRLGFDERHRAFPIHLAYFSSSTLTRLLRRAGWRIEELFTIGIGLEELCARSAPPGKSSGAASQPRRRTQFLRSAIKAAIYGARLGENLCLFATPT